MALLIEYVQCFTRPDGKTISSSFLQQVRRVVRRTRKYSDNFLASIDTSVRWVSAMRLGDEMNGKSKRVKRFFRDRKPGASLVPVLAVAHFGAEGDAGTGGESSDGIWVKKSEKVTYPPYPDVFITISWEQKEVGGKMKYRLLKLNWTRPAPGVNISINAGGNSITFGGIVVSAALWFGSPPSNLPDGVKMIAIDGAHAQPPFEPARLWWTEKNSSGKPIEDDSISLDFSESMATLDTPPVGLDPWHVTFNKP